MNPDRRALVIGLASAGLLPPAAAIDSSASQAPPASSAPPPGGSLYVPRAHLVEDRALLHRFMDEYAFVDLVTPTPALRITHLPVVLDREVGRFGTILGHISAQNPQKAAFDGAHDALVVFRGPHGYISPTWYAKQDVVPTWNFAVVHASGRPRAITDPVETRALLSRLIAKFEARTGSGYDFSTLPEEYVSRLVQGTAPFRMEIDLLEGKFKLGQERSEGDRRGVLEHLQAEAYRERSLHDLTEEFYRRLSPEP